ncbi:carbon-nitrogen hydrolase family protein, partial [Vibrio sp.]|nr:carbon-nitrogen hydrolase family protein [Vibrio sp.]
MTRVGLIQMTSEANPERNLTYISAEIDKLCTSGDAKPEWVILPENALIFGQHDDYHQHAELLRQGYYQTMLSNIASEYGIYLIVGSFPIRREKGITTTTLVFDTSGDLITTYDKLHMFDVDVSDSHKHYRESDTFLAGNSINVVTLPFANIGLSICYDLRFPALFQSLRDRQSDIIIVPAAFTAVTGKAHWEVLLRARAIETQNWIIAVNQTGTHPCGRQTWGHSMVVSPWGEVITHLDNKPRS